MQWATELGRELGIRTSDQLEGLTATGAKSLDWLGQIARVGEDETAAAASRHTKAEAAFAAFRSEERAGGQRAIAVADRTYDAIERKRLSVSIGPTTVNVAASVVYDGRSAAHADARVRIAGGKYME